MLTFDFVMNKSANKLFGLHPVVKLATEKLIERSYNNGVPILITQGLRTIAEQNSLYAQGRDKPGSIVTNAKGGYSFHNFGVAIDFALLLPSGREVSWDTLRDGDKDSLPDWSEVVDVGKELGFEWGGDWRSFKDMPHFQMTFGLTTADYRNGKKPLQSSIDKMLKLINKEVDEVTRAEYEALTKRVEAVEYAQRLVSAPTWFKNEFANDNVLSMIQGDGKSVIVKPATFWETLAVSLRLQGKGNGKVG